MSIILSSFLHVLFIFFLIYKARCYINSDRFVIKQDRNINIIHLLSMDHIKTEIVLNKKKCLSKTLKTIEHKEVLNSNLYKTQKIVENSNNISDSIDNSINIADVNNTINTNDHIFSEIDSTEPISIDNNQSDFFPKIIKYFHPKYPNSARLLGITGELKVRYDINAIGKIEKIRVLSSVPTGIFEENVKLAMRRWIYEQNKPIKNLTIIFKFSLNNTQVSIN